MNNRYILILPLLLTALLAGGNATAQVVVSGSVYGGGNEGEVHANSEVSIATGTVQANVYGGGNKADVTGSVTVTMTGGTVNHDVYGGGALANTNIGNATDYGTDDEDVSSTSTNTTKVYLNGGVIKGDAYGGGLGDLAAIGGTHTDKEAMVYGDITVYLGGDANGPTTKATEVQISKYSGDHSSVVKSGRIFGTNNLNGSPKGDVTVHVYKTVTYKNDGTANDKPDIDHNTYELAAVYGGGNLANFTTEGKSTHVWIHTCDVSIESVYGGGNAAAVPATDVHVEGAREIQYVFGGGNGKDPYTLDNGESWTSNGGANVNGNASTLLTGGYIHEAYGGSNEKGTITGLATMSVNDAAAVGCPLKVVKLVGAGKNADIDGDAILVLGCMPATKIDQIFGGADNANVKGNVELTITSGNFRQVFGGNNAGGMINGHIKLNIEETGCRAITIDELYLGGNHAAYSVYGYYDSGETDPGTGKKICLPRPSEDDSHAAESYPATNATHSFPFANPVLNVISCTSIGKVYGGGLGSDAVMYGSPTVNVNMIPGIKATDIKRTNETANAHDLGAIGDVYGGGAQADVYGKALVNIGTASTVELTSVDDDASTNDIDEKHPNVEGAYITGKVYGGGQAADIHGDTEVNIGTIAYTTTGYEGVNLRNDVFGGGEGNTTIVSGNVKVNLGIKTTTTGDTPTTTYIGNASISGNVYGGSALGAVNATKTVSGNTTSLSHTTGAETAVNIYSGIVTGNVFGGGLGQLASGDDPAIAAKNFGPTTITMENSDNTKAVVSTAVYGGANVNGVLQGSSTVQIIGGTIGADWGETTPSEMTGRVFGGGLGQSTLVNGSVIVNLGMRTGTSPDYSYSGTGIIWGDVYGGSAKGKVNTTDGSAQTSGATTEVNLYGATLHGDLYGGGLGDNTPEAEIAANVYGPVAVTVESGKARNVFGCNNKYGTPKSTVEVVINGTEATVVNGETGAKTYALQGVYGGGNLAHYDPTTPGNYPTVTVNGCETSIKDVYGGGNAAAVPYTNVTINGGDIDRVFAGGNGESGTAANVGYKNSDDTPSSDSYGAGTSNAIIKGGTINKVFGGSNSKGTVRESGTLNINKDSSCDMLIGEVYGGGNLAAGAASTITVGCTGSIVAGESGHAAHPENIGTTLEGIGALYGGANQANVSGNISLAINSGIIANVFGGNNTSGAISGTITVDVEKNDEGCGWYLGNVYGGGNLAAYGTAGNNYPAVNIKNGTVSGSVYGGGKGSTAVVTGNPVVTIGDNVAGHNAVVTGNVYGGGDAAAVTGNTTVIYNDNNASSAIANLFGGGNAAGVSGTATVNMTLGTVTAGVYGGCNASGSVGDVVMNLTGGTVGVNGTTTDVVYGGGYGHGTSTTGNIGITLSGTGTTIYGNLYGGSALGAVGASGKTTTITIGTNTLHGTIFGGGMGSGSGDATRATTNGNVEINYNTTNTNLTGLYGGANVNGLVVGNIVVNVYANVGTDANNIINVFGGGLGENTSTNGNVTVNVGNGSNTPIIYGAIYGGSALGQVNDAISDLTTVNVMSGTINGNIYGGGLGETGGPNVTKGQVNGSVIVNIGTGTVNETTGFATTTSGSATINGSVYGCNNTNGSPKGNVTVNIFKTDHDTNNAATYTAADATYAIDQVFGGGNLADYTPTSTDSRAIVHVYGCDNTIRRVFGGGNAAAAYGVRTIIDGGRFAYVYGGGNGEVVNTSADIGLGGTDLRVHGGNITQLFGGSNTRGTISGSMGISVDATSTCASEMYVDEFFCGSNLADIGSSITASIGCGTHFGDVYGGCNLANITGNVTLTIEGGRIDRNVYGGSKGDLASLGSGHVDKPANIDGNVTLNIYGGYIYGDAFGGSNIYGNITGSITVNMNWQNSSCEDGQYVDNVYGASNLASYTPTTPGSYPVVNIMNGTVTHSVFGGGKGATAIVTSNPVVTIGDNVAAHNAVVTENVYGGGDAAAVTGNTSVTYSDNNPLSTVANLFGGGNAAGVSGTTTVMLTSGKVTTGIYGGCNASGTVGGAVAVNVNGGIVGTDPDGGTIQDVVFGGGKGQPTLVEGSVEVNIGTMTTGETPEPTGSAIIWGNVYGGSALGNVNATGSPLTASSGKTTHVNLYGGTIHGDLFGGGLGQTSPSSIAANVYGPVVVTTRGGTVTNVFGGNNFYGSPQSTVAVNIGGGTITNSVYGGGNLAAYTGTGGVSVRMTNGTVNNNVYGGGLGTTAVVNGSTSVSIEGNTSNETLVRGDVYGGGSLADVTQNVSVSISGGRILNDVYGGGALANTNTDNWNEGTSTLSADVWSEVEGLTEGVSKVFGYYTRSGSDYTEVKDADVLAAANTTYYRKGTPYNTLVSLTGGLIGHRNNNTANDYLGGNVYGGGLGRKAKEEILAEGPTTYTAETAAAYNATLPGSILSGATLTGLVLTEVNALTGVSKTYSEGEQITAGDANLYNATLDGAVNEGQDKPAIEYAAAVTGIEAKVYGDVEVTLDGTAFIQRSKTPTKAHATDLDPVPVPFSGRVFGCNNLNGSPKGNVTVRVMRTVMLGADGQPTTGHDENSFDVHSVYGGGNLAEYCPVTGKDTRVIINGCDDVTIEKVFGGGNSASVPNTDVLILACRRIGYAFGGGNGSDKIWNGTGWDENDGAPVPGIARMRAYGGKIGQAFSGSDTKGEVGTAYIWLKGKEDDSSQGASGGDYSSNSCPLQITNAYGAGRGADINGDVDFYVSGCNQNDEIENVFGGSYDANIRGHITLTITSGIFTQVFGGNDHGGTVGGDITVNIEETEVCNPIIIQHLYGGGREAAYPGAGAKKVTGSTGTGDNITYTYAPVTTGEIKVNIKSATRIDNVYGGSYKGATTGNTEVNINMIKGSFAGQTITLPAGYRGNTIPNSNMTVNYSPIPSDEITVGGENPTPVYGYYTQNETEEFERITDQEAVAQAGVTYFQAIPTGSITINRDIGTIGNVYGGCYESEGVLYGNATVNIGTEPKAKVLKRRNNDNEYDYGATIVDGNNNPVYEGGKLIAGKTVVYDEIDVLGAHITGNVYGGGCLAGVTGKTQVNICAKEKESSTPGKYEYEKVTPGASGVTIAGTDYPYGVFGGGNKGEVDGDSYVYLGAGSVGESVYGGGCEADVKGNTQVTMLDGYVFDGVYGGGLKGSVGTFTRTKPSDHASHDGCVGGKPDVFASGTGKCTVVVSGGQIGPVEVAKADGGMKNTARYYKETGDPDGPVDFGFVFGAGRGEVMSYADNPDADFLTYVKETDVTISDDAFIMASVYGGGENGRVCGNTLVKIQGGQIGCGEGKVQDGKPVRYTSEWEGENPEDFTECSSWDYGEDTNSDGTIDHYNCLPHDPLANMKYSDGSDAIDGSTKASDGHTYYGNVFGGGSGYYPYEYIEGGVQKHDWLRSAGWVEGDTKVIITGGHILTSVYGGNELTDVGGTCQVIMTGGTLGVPRTDADAQAHPVTCYLFGAGKGDQRVHFNTWTNVQNTEVYVSGSARIFGSVFGGGEDGHILGNAVVNIGNVSIDLNGDGDTTDEGETFTASSTLKIGTTGTSYVDGNVFGGGRGFSGEALTAGSTRGNVEVNISDGTMLGSIYGGGRLASVGIDMLPATLEGGDPNPSYGLLLNDVGSNKFGHVKVNISGGTIGNDVVGAKYGGNVFGGSMGRNTLMSGETNPLWPKLAVVKLTEVTISGSALIKKNVYGGGEFGVVRNMATVNVDEGGTILGSVYGGGYGSKDSEPKTTITAAGYSDLYYTFTPMIWNGCVSGNTYVNIKGGKIYNSVYGGGEMASVGLINFNSDASGNYTRITKHANPADNFALSWPYEVQYIPAAPDDPADVGGGKVGGKATVKITGGRIGLRGDDGKKGDGDVYGGGKGVAGDRYEYAFCANVKETEVNVKYPSTPDAEGLFHIYYDSAEKEWQEGIKDAVSNDVEFILGSVYGGGENGHVMGNTKVSMKNGLVGHVLYGGGKGKDKYTDALNNEEIYDISAGRVYGNTTVEMSGGHVIRNVFGGGNMASVGVGNYAVGSEYPTSSYTYPEKAPTNEYDGELWSNPAFTGSGLATVKVTGGKIGFIDETNARASEKDNLPTGNVFGGCRGKAYASNSTIPSYLECSEYYAGYVNETDVIIGDANGGPRIYGSVYGGGQDGHVRRSTNVTVNKGEIGVEWGDPKIKKLGDVPANETPDSYVTSATKDDYQWYLRGNVFGGGSGLGMVKVDGVKKYTNTSGSVVGSTNVTITGSAAVAATYYSAEEAAEYNTEHSLQSGDEGYKTAGDVKTAAVAANPLIHRNVYGGGSLGSVGQETYTGDGAGNTATVKINGTVGDGVNASYGGNVFGACRGVYDSEKSSTVSGKTYATAFNTQVDITDSEIPGTAIVMRDVFGGGENGNAGGSVTVNMNAGEVGHDLYGGGALANTNTNNWDATKNSNKGGWADGKYDTSTHKTTYTTTVNLRGGTVTNDAYGGGLGQKGREAVGTLPAVAGIEAKVYGDVLVELNNNNNGATADGTKVGCKVGRIFGCNNLNGSPQGKVKVHVFATQNKYTGTIATKLGGRRPVLGENNTEGNPAETKQQYLLRLINAAYTEGDPTKALLPGITEAVISAAQTTYEKTSPTDEELTTAVANVQQELFNLYDVKAVYGGANLAPYEPVDAHSTDEETQKAARTEVIIDGCDLTRIYQVYGGGNAASAPATYVRVNGTYEIEELFGGGNGKDNYELDGKWYENPGANVGYENYTHINYDGTQGTGNLDDPYEAIENPDAATKDLRVANYKCGSGIATTEIAGGRIHAVYGGSNKNGNIATTALSIYESLADDCPLTVDETYGAGKDAPQDGTVDLTMDCVREMEEIYGGAKNADVFADIVLNITNGSHFKRVFGGNNTSGAIAGSITVNVEEKGCEPIIIEELYGGGYLAPYSIYGYEQNDKGYVSEDKTYEGIGTFAQRKPLTAASYGEYKTMLEDIMKQDFRNLGLNENSTDAEIEQALDNALNGADVDKRNAALDYMACQNIISSYPKRDPVVNIISATRIGTLFGGGYQALVVGSPHVNVNMTTGKMLVMKKEKTSDDTQIPEGEGYIETIGEKEYVYKDVNGEYYKYSGLSPVDPDDDTNKNYYTTLPLGSIGDIFGGGNMADIYGNTHVEIGTGTHHNMETGAVEAITPVRKEAVITGSVYGGGKMGNVGEYNLTDRKPSSLKTKNTGICHVTISNGTIGKQEGLQMVRYDASGNIQLDADGNPLPPDDMGHVFGGGKGTNLPDDANKVYVDSTEIIINGTAFVKGSVYGGGENGHVLHNTGVKIGGYCQIGAGHILIKNEDGTIKVNRSIDRPYTETEWLNGRLSVESDDFSDLTSDEKSAISAQYAASLPECASWPYGLIDDDGKHHSPYDMFANYASGDKGEYPTTPEGATSKTTDGGRRVASDGSTFYGMVFGGGSGYFPYAPGKWLNTAGKVEGDTWVVVTGGHILTNLYGGNEMTDVGGHAHVIMKGGTLGVPRTLEEIAAHPVTCYIFGAGKGEGRAFLNKTINVQQATVDVQGGWVYGSVFGGAENGHVLGDAKVTVSESASAPASPTYADYFECRATKIGTWGTSYVDGNIFGGGRGYDGLNVLSGTIGGNVTVNITGGTMLGSIYGGGRMASVGSDFSSTTDVAHLGHFVEDTDSKTYGHVSLNISGGTIGKEFTTNVPGAEHSGNVFGGSMGRLLKLDGVTYLEQWPMLAQVKTTTVNITGTPTIYRSVYGGGELGTVRDDAFVTIGGTRNEATGVITASGAPIIHHSVYGGGYGSDIRSAEATKTIEVVDGSTTLHYTFMPMQWAGCVGKNSNVNVLGGHVMRNVYGGGHMASVGIMDFMSEKVTGETAETDVVVRAGSENWKYKNLVKHTEHRDNPSLDNGFILSWPYEIPYLDGFPGTATVNIKGGRIGLSGKDYMGPTDSNGDPVNVDALGNPIEEDNGDVYGGGKGIAGDRYDLAFCANVQNTVVNIDLPTPTADQIEILTKQQYEPDGNGGKVAKEKYSLNLMNPADGLTSGIAGSVYGGAEDGHVMADTKVDIKGGYIGHGVYGGGKGKGTYEVTLDKITSAIVKTDVADNPAATPPTQTTTQYTTDIYSVTAGRVFGNTEVTMSDGWVMRNIYGGGNMGSVGKGNYAGGTDDYSADGLTTGYGEKIPGNLWTTTATEDNPDNAWYFLNSGKTKVVITGGKVGYLVSEADKNKKKVSSKDDLPTGNVFGGCRGESAPNITETPRYHYCPAFFSGYVNQTSVVIGTAGQSNADAGQSGKAPRIYGSVYGGGQDGHVRRDAQVTVNSGEIGIPFSSDNQNIFGTDLDNLHWLHRGNVYGSGSGIGKYEFDFNYDGDYNDVVSYGPEGRKADTKEKDYSSSAGSVTRFTQVDVNGGIIHRNVYGGGSLASVGPPKIGQSYDAYKKDDPADGHTPGRQSMCTVNITGTIGSPTGYDQRYGGEVYGGSRGEKDAIQTEADANNFATTVWTLVHIKDGAYVKGNVFGGGDSGKVKKDTDVKIGGE